MSRKRHEDPSPSGPAEGRDHERQVSPGPKEGEVRAENVLRPRSFAEFVGQEKLKSNLKVFVQAAKQRGTVLDHVLFCGPPGLGKTTLAYIIANELGSRIHVTSGPAVDHKGVLAGLLTNLDEGDVLFIDEIHRLMPVVEENLYPAMEEYRLDVLIGEGPHARAMTLPLPKFTLVGATTRTGLLTSPMRDRFGVVGRVEYYAPEELTEIVQRSAGRLEVGIASDGAAEIGGRARGTPRIANRLLRRVWDFAVVDGRGRIDLDISKTALARLEVDSAGLDGLDRRLLHVIIGSYDGGPVGVDALAASLSEERHTLEEVVEPYLLQQGFVHRTPRGRVATKKAYNHLGLPEPGSGGSASGRQEHLL